MLPVRGTTGAAGYDISATSSCVIPAHGKGIVEIGFAVSLPPGTYARIAPRSGLAYRNFINVGASVVDSDYRVLHPLSNLIDFRPSWVALASII